MKLILICIYPNFYHYFCGNNKDHPNEASYSELAVARGSATINLAEPQAQAGKWQRKQGKLSVRSDWRLLA